MNDQVLEWSYWQRAFALYWLDIAKLPSMWVTSICTPTSNAMSEGSCFPTALLTQGVIKPWDLCQSLRGPLVSQCTFHVCNYLIKSEAEHLFVYLIATWVFFSVIHLFISFAHFFCWLVYLILSFLPALIFGVHVSQRTRASGEKLLEFVGMLVI